VVRAHPTVPLQKIPCGFSNVLIGLTYLPALKYKRRYKWHCGWLREVVLRMVDGLLARASPKMSAKSIHASTASDVKRS
jgi:hypothetical protein